MLSAALILSYSVGISISIPNPL